MKIRTYLTVVFLVVLTTTAFSQDNFREGTNMINLGVGFGNLYYRGSVYGNNFNSTPAFTLSVDHALKEFDEIYGTIGIGGIVGFQSSSSKFTNTSGFYKYQWNNFIIAPRLSYHAGFLNSAKFDLYGGIMLGIRFESFHYTTNYGFPDPGNYGGGAVFTGGGFLGGAWYFHNNLGAFAELGYDVSYLKVGLCLKTGTDRK